MRLLDHGEPVFAQPHDALGVLELVEVDLALEGTVEAKLNNPLGRVEHDEQAVAPGVVGEAGGILADAPDDHRPLGQGILVEARRLLRLAKRLAKQQACRCD